MKVYVVLFWDYGESNIVAVFSTYRKAAEYISSSEVCEAYYSIKEEDVY